MKRHLVTLLAAGAALTLLPAIADAQQGQGRGRGGFEQNDGPGRGRGQVGDDINQRQQALAVRIDAAQRSGALTRGQADQLRGELEAIARLEANYRLDGLSPQERNDLLQRLDNLDRRIPQERMENGRDVDERQDAILRRLDTAQRNNTMPRAEIDRLRAAFNDIARIEANYRLDGLTSRERDDLLRRLDELERRIRDDRLDGRDIDQRQEQVLQRIDRALRDRLISQAEANQLRSDFNAIARIEADYRRDGLTTRERDDLMRRLDELERRIRDDRFDGRDIDQRQEQISQRIDRALRNGAITQAEANRLRADFNAIARIEADYRRDGLTRNERDDLLRRLDELDRRFRDERADQGRGGQGVGEFAAVRARIESQITGTQVPGLSFQEAQPMRAELNAIVQLEAGYLLTGARLDPQERAELQRRYDRLQAWIDAERLDNNSMPNPPPGMGR